MDSELVDKMLKVSDVMKRAEEGFLDGMTTSILRWRIDQLERELDSRCDIIIKMHDQLAAEKALADRLIVAGANALQNYTLFIKKFSDDWDDACAAYRKARGM